jgi:ElaB/YqjD/DUF883 family membrane-anchored ribosome-binding protein
MLATEHVIFDEMRREVQQLRTQLDSILAWATRRRDQDELTAARSRANDAWRDEQGRLIAKAVGRKY